MAKAAYIGVSGVARKIKKGYIGVDGIARKIKKAYIGIGGVARPFWGGGTLARWGLHSEGLSVSVERNAATTVGNYALVGGGENSNSTALATMNAFDTSLTRSIPTSLGAAKVNHAATSIGNYALFGGGYNSSAVYAYNASLTRSTATSLQNKAENLAATTLGNYAIFGGGRGTVSATKTVDAYNASLTRTKATNLTGGDDSVATTVGNYAIFVNGENTDEDSDYYGYAYMDAYNASLTKQSVNAAIMPVSDGCATSVGDYAIIHSYGDAIYAYNKSLTKVSIEACTESWNRGATTLGNFALFAGSTDYSQSKYTKKIVDVYDTSLTKTTADNLETARGGFAAVTLGDFALFCGGQGYNSNSTTNAVDVYTLV